MSISPPKQVAPYQGRDRDCEAAIGPLFDELIQNLQRSGLSEPEIVVQLESALVTSAKPDALSEDLETVKGWAVHAGWEPSEVDRAFARLSEAFYARIGSRKPQDE